MLAPPVELGAVQETARDPLFGVTAMFVGAPGVVTGVTDVDGDEAAPVPLALVALTVKVYAVPFVRPVTVVVVDVAPGTKCVAPPGATVTVYPVMAEPSFEGSLQVMTAEAFPASTFVIWGASGTVDGVTALDGEDGEDVPIPFVAVTVKVYAVPFVRPVTVPDVAVAPLTFTEAPPGLAVTVYDEMAESPSFAGSTHETVALAFPATAVTLVGASGTVWAGVIVNESVPVDPAIARNGVGVKTALRESSPTGRAVVSYVA